MAKCMNRLCKLLIFSLLFVMSGCWDQEEIDRRAYVLGIGLDKGADEGSIAVTYLISNPEAGSSQQGGGTPEPTHEVITFEATSFIQSQNVANGVVAKNITYDIIDLLIVSEEFARDKQFIRWIYDATKDREIRKDTKIIVTKEKASQFIEKNKPKLETRQHEYFEIMLNNATRIGLIPSSEIHKFFRITEADADLFIAAFATTEQEEDTTKGNTDNELLAGKLDVKGNTNPTQFLGSAVFKEGQMIGLLTVEETRLSQLINPASEKPNFLASIQDPFIEDFQITLRISQLKNADVKVDVKAKTPTIHVNLPLQVEVLTDHSMVNYAKNKDKRNQLKEYLKERIEKKYEGLLQRTQKEFTGQPFGFSLAARKHFLTIQQWMEYNWMKSYPDARVNVNVEISFGEFGRQSELPDYRKVRDQ